MGPMAKSSALLALLVCLALGSRMPSVLGFGVVGATKRCRIGGIQTLSNLLSSRVVPGWNGRSSRRRRSSNRSGSMEAKPDPNSDNTEIATTTGSTDQNDTTAVDNFDGKGFAEYLLPYALALIGSIVATGAMFKFVLLDY